MKKSGIYYIENLKNGKKYIGQSVDLERRKYEHFWMLEGNNHDNGHLQNAYNKYGEENFKFRILLYCELFELTKYEQFFVDYYTPELLYNVRLECVDSNQGITFSEEARRKMSETKRGKHHSKETKKKMSEAHRGKHLSEETRKKISETKRGEDNPMYGKHHSEETKRKLSEANSGKNHPMYGKHHSKEAKRKMSVALSGENSSSSKLTENQIFEILDLYYNKNKSQTDIAKIFLVNSMTISYIVRGKRWKHCYKKFMEKSEK